MPGGDGSFSCWHPKDITSSHFALTQTLTNMHVHESKRSVILTPKLDGFKVCGKAGKPSGRPSFAFNDTVFF